MLNGHFCELEGMTALPIGSTRGGVRRVHARSLQFKIFTIATQLLPLASNTAERNASLKPLGRQPDISEGIRPGAFSADTSPRPTEAEKCSLTAQSRSGDGPACVKAAGPSHRRTRWSGVAPVKLSRKSSLPERVTCGQHYSRNQADRNQIMLAKKKRGRPPTGRGETIGVRVHPELMEKLDAWRARDPEFPTRPEAIRRLVVIGLARPGPYRYPQDPAPPGTRKTPAPPRS
jgi:hypothetical protein